MTPTDEVPRLSHPPSAITLQLQYHYVPETAQKPNSAEGCHANYTHQVFSKIPSTWLALHHKINVFMRLPVRSAGLGLAEATQYFKMCNNLFLMRTKTKLYIQ